MFRSGVTDRVKDLQTKVINLELENHQLKMALQQARIEQRFHGQKRIQELEKQIAELQNKWLYDLTVHFIVQGYEIDKAVARAKEAVDIITK